MQMKEKDTMGRTAVMAGVKAEMWKRDKSLKLSEVNAKYVGIDGRL